MRIWLITVGESLPTDGPDERLQRTGILASLLSRSGHEVLWWNSSFDHVRKTQRTDRDTCIELADNYRVMLLRSSGYRRNISVARLRDHREHAAKFRTLAPRQAAPDVILCSMPTIDLSRAAVEFAAARKIPIALDIRDLWPEIFVDLAPPWARGVARLALQPLFGDLRWACSRATALTSITPQILEWGLGYAGRPRGAMDRAFPFGYVERRPEPEEIERANRFWKERGVGVAPGEFLVCFFGTIGMHFDLETVIEAARRLEGGGRPVRFVLCGSGDRLAGYQEAARGLSNVVFPGWVGSSEIWTLMRLAKLGLAPYRNTKDFQSSLPNKTIEYLSAGLPLLSCLKGVLKELLEENGCGVPYAEADPGSLARAVEEAYDRQERLDAMSDNALRLYRAKFTAETVYGEMMLHLEKLAGRAPAGDSGGDRETR